MKTKIQKGLIFAGIYLFVKTFLDKPLNKLSEKIVPQADDLGSALGRPGVVEAVTMTEGLAVTTLIYYLSGIAK